MACTFPRQIREMYIRGCPFLILHTRLEEIFEQYQNVSHPGQRLYKCFAPRAKTILSINNRSIMKYGVPQGSVLGPLLFLIYINDLHQAIKYSAVHHFADDTNLLTIGLCIKKIQVQVNQDLKCLSNWLKANKIALNTSKTEVIMFRQRNTGKTQKINLNHGN